MAPLVGSVLMPLPVLDFPPRLNLDVPYDDLMSFCYLLGLLYCRIRPVRRGRVGPHPVARPVDLINCDIRLSFAPTC